MAADGEDGDGSAFFGSGAGGDEQWDQAGDEGEGGHQDGSQAVAIGLDDGGMSFHPFASQGIRMIDL